MPMYEYKCRACGAVFEELQPTGSTGEELSCPQCGARQSKKRMSTFAGRMGAGKSAAPEFSCPTGGCCHGGSCGL